MSEARIHAKIVAERFPLDNAPAIVTRVLRKTEIDLLGIRGDTGKPKRDPRFPMDERHDALDFHLSPAAFEAIADDMSAPLDHRRGVGIDDPLIRNFGAALRDGFAHPERVSRMLLERVILALAIHVAQAYGGRPAAAMPAKGGLAPWQLRRSTELLASNLDGSVALKTLADACRLSTGHFSRAFRASTGLTPVQWLAHRRIEAAKALIQQRRGSLGEVALACGFSDQSHFTRIFTRIVGTSPGAWRRTLER